MLFLVILLGASVFLLTMILWINHYDYERSKMLPVIRAVKVGNLMVVYRNTDETIVLYPYFGPVTKALVFNRALTPEEVMKISGDMP